MSFSNYLEGHVLAWAFNGTVMPTAPSAWYAIAHDSTPDDDGVGGELVAADAAEWVRKTVTFATQSGGQAISDLGVSWVPTTGGPWTITHISIWDSGTSEAGNCLAIGALQVSKEVSTSVPLAIAIGDIIAALD